MKGTHVNGAQLSGTASTRTALAAGVSVLVVGAALRVAAIAALTQPSSSCGRPARSLTLIR